MGSRKRALRRAFESFVSELRRSESSRQSREPKPSRHEPSLPKPSPPKPSGEAVGPQAAGGTSRGHEPTVESDQAVERKLHVERGLEELKLQCGSYDPTADPIRVMAMLEHGRRIRLRCSMIMSDLRLPGPVRNEMADRWIEAHSIVRELEGGERVPGSDQLLATAICLFAFSAN